jgi:hypothetical protein
MEVKIAILVRNILILWFFLLMVFEGYLRGDE